MAGKKASGKTGKGIANSQRAGGKAEINPQRLAGILAAFIFAYAAFIAGLASGAVGILSGSSALDYSGIGAIAFFAIFALAASLYAWKEHGIKSGIFAFVFLFTMVLMKSAGFFLLDFAIIWVFVAIPFYYYLSEGAGIRKASAELGLRLKGGVLRAVCVGIAGAFGMFFISAAISVLLFFLGFADQERVHEKISGFPSHLLFAAVFLSPVAEEILFRGFLYRRFGIILSSAVFSASHLFYGSVAEIVVAFFLAAFLCVLFQRSGSLYPAIIAHSLFNLATVMFVVFA